MSPKEVAVVGGTGAQGIPIVTSLSSSGRYHVRVLTRDPNSHDAKVLSALSNVTLIKGEQSDEKAIHELFKGAHAAFVNLNGFAIGEKHETWLGYRVYEIARHEKIKHYVFATVDYCVKKAGWDEKCHWGNDAKGRVGEFILAQGQEEIKSTLFCTGPYMDMLLDGVFVPRIEPDGTRVWLNPGGNGKIPLIALDDLGAILLWILDHPSKSAGLNLEIAADQCSIADIVKIFTQVTGLSAVEKSLPYDTWAAAAEPFPDAPSNYHDGPTAPKDKDLLSYKENLRGFWNYWASGYGATRDFELLDRIHPGRIRGLADWMRRVEYTGEGRPVMKGYKRNVLKAGESKA